MYVLGIETSCDETAVAIVDDSRRIVAQTLLSQLVDHRPYGGVVPEIAARAHLDHLDTLVVQTMNQAELTWDQIDAIAATAGPGLIGGVMMGLMTAKAMALAANKPLIPVNHLEAHALTARLTNDIPFPYILLLLSGGHCQILLVEGVGEYQLIGQTIDDAIGEAFDKVAKMVGLPYPGGPELEKLLVQADPFAAQLIDLPRPLLGRKNCDFSFSGLKTAVRNVIGHDELDVQQKANLSLAFHDTLAAILDDRLTQAFYNPSVQACRHLVVAGGVAANQFLNARLKQFCAKQGITFLAPPLSLCTDNAAMIAWVGIEYLRLGVTFDDALAFAARPRWPLYKEGVNVHE
jgi:N6-L-threonylcarbamoyladenine synthase